MRIALYLDRIRGFDDVLSALAQVPFRINSQATQRCGGDELCDFKMKRALPQTTPHEPYQVLINRLALPAPALPVSQVTQMEGFV
jgi:hypothetical protein